jgi:hypothetical protein
MVAVWTRQNGNGTSSPKTYSWLSDVATHSRVQQDRHFDNMPSYLDKINNGRVKFNEIKRIGQSNSWSVSFDVTKRVMVPASVAATRFVACSRFRTLLRNAASQTPKLLQATSTQEQLATAADGDWGLATYAATTLAVMAISAFFAFTVPAAIIGAAGIDAASISAWGIDTIFGCTGGVIYGVFSGWRDRKTPKDTALGAFEDCAAAAVGQWANRSGILIGRARGQQIANTAARNVVTALDRLEDPRVPSDVRALATSLTRRGAP